MTVRGMFRCLFHEGAPLRRRFLLIWRWRMYRWRLWAAQGLYPNRYPQTVEEWFASWPEQQAHADRVARTFQQYFGPVPIQVWLWTDPECGLCRDLRLTAMTSLSYPEAEIIMDRLLEEWWFDYQQQHRLIGKLEISFEWV